jgi:putative endonuclease
VARSWYLYIVRCAKGALYTGISPDVETRIHTHNAGKGAKALKALGLPVTLVYQEFVGSYSAALRREAAVKRLTRAEKEEFLRGRASFLSQKP